MTSSSPSSQTKMENTRPSSETDCQRPRILVVDNENWALNTVGATLQSAGYNLITAATGSDALQRFHRTRPDLVLLELCLPDMDGKAVLLRLREWTITPVIVVSVRKGEEEKVACFDSGADDYITKPFTTGELLARLRAALRRAFGVPRGKVFITGALQIDFARREVMVESQPVQLTATEYDLLKVLAIHAGSVRTHCQLIHEVWGSTQYQDAAHLLRATVSNLRRKLLSDSGRLCPIVTDAGVGYRLQAGEMAPYLGLRPFGVAPAGLSPTNRLADNDTKRQKEDERGGGRHGHRGALLDLQGL